LGLNPRRDAWIYVPSGYDPALPAPLVVSLHGAGGEGRGHLGHLRSLADEHRLLLLAPTSVDGTWDVIRGGYGPDVSAIEHALNWTFDRYAVNPARIAVEGFSDGASYSLSIGLTNGDLFSCILAFSPGFMAPAVQRGAPRIFISHGTGDSVLGIDVCSRRLVPRLEAAGYDLRYVEFTGGHTVPEDVAEDGVRWFLQAADGPEGS
jgi:phospholipase/carboxylesterase